MALKNNLGKVNLYILIKHTKGILGTRWKLQTGIRGSRGFFHFRDTKVLGIWAFDGLELWLGIWASYHCLPLSTSR